MNQRTSVVWSHFRGADKILSALGIPPLVLHCDSKVLVGVMPVRIDSDSRPTVHLRFSIGISIL